MAGGLNKEQRYAADIYESVKALFDKEDERFKYDLETVDLTAFFTGFIMANNILVNSVTGEDFDVLDTLAQNNKLFYQYTKK